MHCNRGSGDQDVCFFCYCSGCHCTCKQQSQHAAVKADGAAHLGCGCVHHVCSVLIDLLHVNAMLLKAICAPMLCHCNHQSLQATSQQALLQSDSNWILQQVWLIDCNITRELMPPHGVGAKPWQKGNCVLATIGKCQVDGAITTQSTTIGTSCLCTQQPQTVPVSWYKCVLEAESRKVQT